MKRTTLNTNTGLLKTEQYGPNGECTASAFTTVSFELCEFNTVKIDTDKWYVIVGTPADNTLLIERILEMDVLDDYLTSKQCEELNAGDM